MNINQVRELFPHITAGKIYFNHASTGPFSKPVLDAVNDYLLQRSETNIDNYEELMKKTAEVKVYLARMLNCEFDRLTFIDNTSNGMNILAQGIKWKNGDSILLNDIEFPANVYPFLNLEKEGVIIEFVKSQNGIVSAEDIINSIKPSTKLISISFVQFLSGYKSELKKIGEVCREKGIIFSVDAIQGLGAFTLDVIDCNIDFISCGTAKWLLGMQGLAFIYMSEMLQETLQHKFVGWISVENEWNHLDYKLKFRQNADAFRSGTVNALGIFSLLPSLKLFYNFGYKNVENRILENSFHLMQKLSALGINPILKDCNKKNISGIVSFTHPNALMIVEELQKIKIFCSVREGMVRLSPHFYNTKEDIDVVTDEIDKIIISLG